MIKVEAIINILFDPHNPPPPHEHTDITKHKPKIQRNTHTKTYLKLILPPTANNH